MRPEKAQADREWMAGRFRHAHHSVRFCNGPCAKLPHWRRGRPQLADPADSTAARHFERKLDEAMKAADSCLRPDDGEEDGDDAVLA